jgi:hypothetical protein
MKQETSFNDDFTALKVKYIGVQCDECSLQLLTEDLKYLSNKYNAHITYEYNNGNIIIISDVNSKIIRNKKIKELLK